MVDSNETQALVVVSNQVLESQINIIFNNQCKKAQDFLFSKIKKELERLQELCNSIYQANSIMDLEITAAQEVIKSLFSAEMSLKAANVQLQKDIIIMKDKFCFTDSDNRAKCEMLWIESKNRYESLPFVKNFLESNKRVQNIRNELNELQNKVENLNEAIIIKKNDIATTDKKRIIELANFLQIEMPSKLKLIEEKKRQINDLTKEKERLNNKTNPWDNFVLTTNNYNTKSNDKLFIEGKDLIDKSPLKIQFGMDFPDLDTLHIKLNQIKQSNSSITITEIEDDKTKENMDSIKNQSSESKKTDDYMSVYFKKPYYNASAETKSCRLTKRKFIDILEDVKIDKSEAVTLISQANPQKLLCVNSITTDFNRSKVQPVITEEIEEIDMSRDENIVMPPTQFKDVIERAEKKKVSFDVTPMEVNEGDKPIDLKEAYETSAQKDINEIKNTTQHTNIGDRVVEDNANETISSLMEEGNLSDNSNKIKEIMLRQEKLNLSPQFVYGRNINIMEDRSVVTSKFFKRNESDNFVIDMLKNKNEDVKHVEDNNSVKKVIDKTSERLNKNINNETVAHMDIDNVAKKPEPPTKLNKPITGMFQHTSQGLPSSLNITGLDDGDADYPQCVDSSLLLSPKADISSENTVDQSKEVSNFLSSFKRTIFPLFGQVQAVESKPDTSAQNQNNQFSFNFTSQEKKNRSALFNMFK